MTQKYNLGLLTKTQFTLRFSGSQLSILVSIENRNVQVLTTDNEQAKMSKTDPQPSMLPHSHSTQNNTANSTSPIIKNAICKFKKVADDKH